MSYTYPVDVKALWGERKSQFVNFGVPQEEVNRLIDVVTDMWTDGPGGWCYEWSQLADRYAQAGDARLAVLAYGGARFPCLATADKSAALQHQIEQYGLAAKDFPVSYERRFVTTKYQGKIVEVPVHILSEHDATNDTPVLVATGGIDTLKVDLHLQWVTYVLGAHVRVVAVDIPGTGELSNIAMTRGSTEILDQVVAFARTLTTGKVGQLGMSFGGLFAAHAGLTQVVDAAVVVGGPVSTAFDHANAERLLYGMRDIFGNAVGFTEIPTVEQAVQAGTEFKLDDLLATNMNCPMLVVNGDADVHIPLADTKIFEGRPNTDVQLIPGAGHCAFDHLSELLHITTGWLATALH